MELPKIPFNRVVFKGDEVSLVSESLESGKIAGDQKYTKKCESFLEQALGPKRALLTTSCTHALEMAALLLNISSEDEIIVPSYTFVSTANAFAMRGAKIIFCDIRPDTLNLCEKAFEALITNRTKAVVPVHYAGVACEMDAIMAIAKKNNIAVIEDNAHGFLGTYKGSKLGTIGDFGTQSFHETKNITCGEGGALLINRVEHVERAEIIREKGTNRAQFLNGEVDKYSWVDIGSSYVMSDILAALLFSQLNSATHIQNRRMEIWKNYRQALGEWAHNNQIQLPFVPEACEQTYHMFYLLLPDLDSRNRFIAHLKSHGISSTFHYLPLDQSAMGKLAGIAPHKCPNTQAASDRIVRLPLFPDLTDSEQCSIIERALEFTP